VFTLIFVSLFVLAWLALGFIPWLAVSVATRGQAGIVNLPLCLFAGVVAGLAVPLLFNQGESGIWLSMVAAFAAASMLMGLRRISLGVQTSGADARSESRGG